MILLPDFSESAVRALIEWLSFGLFNGDETICQELLSLLAAIKFRGSVTKKKEKSIAIASSLDLNSGLTSDDICQPKLLKQDLSKVDVSDGGDGIELYRDSSEQGVEDPKRSYHDLDDEANRPGNDNSDPEDKALISPPSRTKKKLTNGRIHGVKRCLLVASGEHLKSTSELLKTTDKKGAQKVLSSTKKV